MFARSYKDDVNDQADDEESIFEKQKARQKYLAQSLQMEVRTRDEPSRMQFDQGMKKTPDLPIANFELARSQQMPGFGKSARTDQEKFLSLDHFLNNKTEEEHNMRHLLRGFQGDFLGNAKRNEDYGGMDTRLIQTETMLDRRGELYEP